MQTRMEKIQKNSFFDFHCFYTNLRNQTFIEMPWPTFQSLFTPIPFKLYEDEIDVHMHMFDSKDSGYALLIQQVMIRLHALYK